jgi:hypothetical protein
MSGGNQGVEARLRRRGSRGPRADLGDRRSTPPSDLGSRALPVRPFRSLEHHNQEVVRQSLFEKLPQDPGAKTNAESAPTEQAAGPGDCLDGRLKVEPESEIQDSKCPRSAPRNHHPSIKQSAGRETDYSRKLSHEANQFPSRVTP